MSVFRWENPSWLFWVCCLVLDAFLEVRNRNLTFQDGGWATCICGVGDKGCCGGWAASPLVLGLVGRSPGEGHRAAWWWVRPLLPVIALELVRMEGRVPLFTVFLAELVTLWQCHPCHLRFLPGLIISSSPPPPNTERLLKWITQRLFDFFVTLLREGKWVFEGGRFFRLWARPPEVCLAWQDMPSGRTSSSGRRWPVPRAGSERALLSVCRGRWIRHQLDPATSSASVLLHLILCLEVRSHMSLNVPSFKWNDFIQHKLFLFSYSSVKDFRQRF